MSSLLLSLAVLMRYPVRFNLNLLQSDSLLQDRFKKMLLLHFYSALHEKNFANFKEACSENPGTLWINILR